MTCIIYYHITNINSNNYSCSTGCVRVETTGCVNVETARCVNVETTGCVRVEKTAYEVRQKCHGPRTLLH